MSFIKCEHVSKLVRGYLVNCVAQIDLLEARIFEKDFSRETRESRYTSLVQEMVKCGGFVHFKSTQSDARTSSCVLNRYWYAFCFTGWIITELIWLTYVEYYVRADE
jgi:hypothetical protein